jgi:hypothetical protein
MWTVHRVTNIAAGEQPLSVLDLIEHMRVRPALFLGANSLSALWYFLRGYHMGLRGNPQVSIATSPLEKEFHDWVAYRLHFLESTTGWRNMILQHIQDEKAALNRFFELFDEYRFRRPRSVARLDGLKQYMEVSDGKERVRSFPSTLLLVAYTEDSSCIQIVEKCFPDMALLHLSIGLRPGSR